MSRDLLPDWKCARCGASLKFTAFFFDRAPFNPETDLYCPSCWLQKLKEVSYEHSQSSSVELLPGETKG